MIRRHLLAFPILAACAAGPPPSSAPVTAPESLALRRLVQSHQSGVAEAERQVFRDTWSFGQFWARLGDAELPPVDFRRELVVAVAAGQKSSGGHSISVGRAYLADGTLTIEVLKAVPGRECPATLGLTTPVDVVAVSTSGVQRWSFVERTVTETC